MTLGLVAQHVENFWRNFIFTMSIVLRTFDYNWTINNILNKFKRL